MPLYEYSCDDCSGKFDVLTSYADRDNRKQVCPTCESTHTKVMISSFAAFGSSEAGSEPVSLGGGGGCGPGCCGGACSAN
ncbi:MAG TPA: zinc ribbon domain-containing protein [Candidatus Dormibacteraeota bacterium]|jgi:putative FmdB family regulatory protein